MPRITELRKDAMKQAIYEAAVEVLTRDGLDHATMDRVAVEAGVAKGSLYNYFRSKNDLLEFVFSKTVDPLQEAIEAVVDSPAPVVEKLRGTFCVIFEYLQEHRRLFGFLLGQQTVQELITPSRSPGPSVLTRILKQGVEDGVFRRHDVGFHATAIYGAIRGIGDDCIAKSAPWPVAQIVEDLVRFCVAGLAQEQSGASRADTPISIEGAAS